MSDATRTPDEVNNLIKDGGAPLEEALKKELNAAEGTPTADESDDSKTKGDEDADAGSEDLEDEGESSDKDKSKDDAKDDEKPESKKDDDKSKGDADHSKGKKTGRKSRVEKILHQRNSARIAAEAERVKREEAEKRAADAEAKLAAKGEESDEDESESDDDSDDESNDIDKVIDRKMDERERRMERNRQKADADRQERDALVADFSPSKEELKAVDDLLKTHPTLSDEAAYRIVNPSAFADGASKRGDARKLETGAQSKRSLRQEPSPSSMTTEEMRQHLKSEVKSGRMAV